MPKHYPINSLRPRKPEGSLGRPAQDGHLDSHTAPELCIYAAASDQAFNPTGVKIRAAFAKRMEVSMLILPSVQFLPAGSPWRTASHTSGGHPPIPFLASTRHQPLGRRASHTPLTMGSSSVWTACTDTLSGGSL